MTIDPAEPEVRRKHASPRLFDRTAHEHVIENLYCNICQVEVWVEWSGAWTARFKKNRLDRHICLTQVAHPQVFDIPRTKKLGYTAEMISTCVVNE